MRSARLLGETADEEDEPDTDADEIFVPGHVGPVTQRLNSLELEMLKVKNLQAENAEITNANIRNIRAGNIDVDALFARDIMATGSFQVNNGAWKLVQDTNGLALETAATTQSLGLPVGMMEIKNGWINFRISEETSTLPKNYGFSASLSDRKHASIFAYSTNVFVAEDYVHIGGGYNTTEINAEGNILPSSTNTYDLGSTSLRWNYIYLSHNPNVSSDRNVKHDISEDVPDIVDKLIPVQYKRKGDPDTVYYGFIAQDVDNALKQIGIDTDNIGLVTFETDAKGNKTNYALSYEEFIPLLTAKIQSQQKQIDSLTKRLELLERMMNDGR